MKSTNLSLYALTLVLFLGLVHPLQAQEKMAPHGAMQHSPATELQTPNQNTPNAHGNHSNHSQHEILSAADTQVASDSLHHITAALTDQNGKPFSLASVTQPFTLITMFYGDCKLACPVIIQNLKQTVAALRPVDQKRLKIAVISLNAKVDTPAKLSRLMQDNQLDPAIVTLAVAKDDSDTRIWATALGIKYRRLPDGEINHSNRQVLLNQAGQFVADSTLLSPTPDPVFLEKIQAELGAHKPSQ